MAQYESLKATIDAYIRQNGVKAITGPVLNGVLNAMVDSLGGGFLFEGEALPNGNPGTPDQNVIRYATRPGTYTNYGGYVHDGKHLVWMVWNGSWHAYATQVPTDASLPTLISQLTNDAGYITAASLAAYYTKVQTDALLSGKQATLVSGTNIKTINNESLLGPGNIDIQGGSQVQADWDEADPTDPAYIKNKPTIPSAPGTLDTDNASAQTPSASESLAGTVKLHKVAKTGSYADLLNKPTIPADKIFIATYGTTTYADILAAYNAGKAVFVNKSDEQLIMPLILIDATNASFGGEISGYQMYFAKCSNSDVWSKNMYSAELLSNRVSSWQATPSNNKYPTEKLVKDSLDGKQPTIDSSHKLDYSLIDNAPGVANASTLGLVKVNKAAGGINISGDILVLDTASAAEIAAKTTVCALKVSQIDKAVQVGVTTNTISLSDAEKTSAMAWLGVYDAIHPAVQTSQPAGGFAPNILYNLGELSGNTTFALATPPDANIANHYYWTFDTPASAPSITWPAGITWLGGSAPTINASKHYEISVLNGIGVAMEV